MNYNKNLKNVNGKNKLERQINKAKKYVGLTLAHASNNYLKVIGIDDPANTYVFFGETNEYEDKVIIQATNMDRGIFIKKFATVQSKMWRNGGFVYFTIFRPYFDNDKKMCEENAKGAEELFNLNEWLKNNGLEIRKA